MATAGWLFYLWEQPFPAQNPEPVATVLYNAAGQPLATFSEQYRVKVALAQIPPVVVHAVVSTEDRHFFSEGGVNPTSILRAAWADVSGGSGLQGGSTITQQYVKQAYLNSNRTVERKIQEAVLALKVSQSEPKQEILERYLNIIYWGRGAYGIEAASRVYFGKDVGQLTLREASLLAAIIKDPQGADPANAPGLARKFQKSTLDDMVRDKVTSPADAAAVEATPYSAYVLPPPSQVSQAEAGSLGDDYFIDAVHQQLYARYGRALVDGGGLRVTTTFDPVLQKDAYSAVYGTPGTGLDPGAGDPSGAVVSLDDNGQVKALVGGQDYRRSAVDLAFGAAGGGTGRQAGSTFKALMLAEVVREGYTVDSVFPAPPQVALPGGNANGSTWTVSNYEGEAVAPQIDLVDATAASVNTVYAQIVARIGADKLDDMAKKLGIDPAELPSPYPSQVLGTADVSPLEMAAAYATFADGGVYHSPILVTKVVDASGRTLPLPVIPSARQVLTPQQAAVVSWVLQQVVLHGTGTAAGGLPFPVAGKTGTTQNAGDAWFVGYTPKLTTALWMGYADSDRSMDGFRHLASVSGGSIPAQLWHDYMAGALRDEPQWGAAFGPPPDLAGTTLVPWRLDGDTIVVGSAPAAAVPAPTVVSPPVISNPPPTVPGPVQTVPVTTPAPYPTSTVGSGPVPAPDTTTTVDPGTTTTVVRRGTTTTSTTSTTVP